MRRLIISIVPLLFSLSMHGIAQHSRFHTHPSLLADVQSIKPGATFTIGVLMKMDPGWHTYWKNSGEAGLPTQIRWTLPPGFTAGDVQWPLPQKDIEEGDVLTFGYSGETMLLVQVTAPKDLRGGAAISLKADVNWLECKRQCVPGNGSVELTLFVKQSDPKPANDMLFDTYRKKIPEPFTSSSDVSSTSEVRAGTVILHLTPARAGSFAGKAETTPEFYPESLDGIVIGRTLVTVSAHELSFQIPLSVNEKIRGPRVFRGVVVYRLESEELKAVELTVPLPSEFCESLPLAGSATPSHGILDQSFVTSQTSGTQQSLLLYVGFALVGGLLLNIMPCVLPVIALKIFGLVRMAGDHPGRVKRLGWFFSLGILASFLCLGLFVIVVQAAGQQIGWGFQFQEPLFVIAMSAVVFAFGLSLFGVYEIRPPAAALAGATTLLAHGEKGGNGYRASFLEGVFATILATPCTAPFLGSALGFAFSQSPWIILIIFTSVAVGMALPYLILTANPAWLKYLPKPGEWMVTAKQFMGFLMMATLLWLLYILGKQLGMEAVIWTCAFLLTTGIACWLIGRFATLTATRTRFVITWAAAIAIVAGGYWVFMESALDVRAVIAGVSPGRQSGSLPESGGIQWKPFSITSLEAELQGNKTVFIDFTADWCLTCKVNERTVLANKAVIEKFRALDIIAIRADWTSRNPDITRLLAKFGRSGVPLYVIFPAGDRTAPIVLPEVVTSAMVTEALGRATGAASTNP